MIKLFNDLALGLVGHTRGGPAKVAVISSGLMGTISGSGVANVLTVGQFTIPLMKRFGYSPVFAGAVEATASMGGQIMPPVMGAVAFIMAETLNVPYADDRQGGGDPGLPLLLHRLHDGAPRGRPRRACIGLPKDQCPNPWTALKRALVPGAAAGGAGLHAVPRLHADVRRHGRAGADRDPDPRRGDRRARSRAPRSATSSGSPSASARRRSSSGASSRCCC